MNILLTSVGRRTYLVHYFQHALQGEGKVFASNSVMTYTMEQADQCVITPHIYDSSYIDFLLEYCKCHEIKAIVSCFDIDLPILATSKLRFEEAGIVVLVSSPEVIAVCNDKWRTYQEVTKMGIRTPRTWLTVDEVKTELKNKALNFPVVLKPRWGMG